MRTKQKNDPAASLPQQILFNILSRLPTRCLMKCKSLRKSPEFVGLHLEHAKKNNQRLLFDSSESGNTKLHSSDYETLNHSMVDYSFRLPDSLAIVSTCNGLVCISDYRTMIVIGNPATEKYFPFSFHKFDVLPENYKEVFCLGFGYDPVRSVYEVVRIDLSYNINEDRDGLYTENTKVFLYTLGCESWREFQTPFPLDRGIPTLPYVSCAVHVFERTPDCKLKDHQIVWAIVSFDPGSGDFRRIQMPATGGGGLNLGALQECLSVSVTKEEGRNLDIWLLKNYGVMKSWTKVYSICLDSIQSSYIIFPLAVWDDNILLLQQWGSKSSAKTSIYAYDLSSTDLQVHLPGIDNWMNVDAYVESLVPVPHLSSEQKNSLGRKRKVRNCFYFLKCLGGISFILLTVSLIRFI